MASARPQVGRPADIGAEPSPVVIRRHSGWLLIEIRQEIGPAAEPHLGRLLHGAIRPGCTGVLLDLRHSPGPGEGGIGVLLLARTLADRHGLTFGCVGHVRGTPALPPSGQQRPEQSA
ncbi:hypothetical protein [Streptomyces spinosirectus]